jgi:hypothetical protein
VSVRAPQAVIEAELAVGAVSDTLALARVPVSSVSSDVHPNEITIWRGQLTEGAAEVFGSDSADRHLSGTALTRRRRLKLFKKSIVGGVPIVADRDPAQLEIPEQSKLVSSSIMGSRFSADLQSASRQGYRL